MKKDITTIVIGILFLLAGIAVGGSMLGLFDFTINFAGWWTLFLIIPALLGILQGGFNVGNIILLCVGIILLLNAQNILPDNFSWRLILPLILFIVGFQLLFGNKSGDNSSGNWFNHKFASNNSDSENSNFTFTSKTSSDTSKASFGSNASYKTASVLFGGQDIKYGPEEFTGGTYTSIFGGCKINLSNVTLIGDVIISVTALFGAIELILPANVQVISNILPILGGADCKYVSSRDPLAPKIIINGNVSFGGIEIK